MAEREEQFLRDIRSGDKDVRFAAWRSAGEVDPSVIPQLGKLAIEEGGVGKAARESLVTMVHGVGRELGPRRNEVVKGMLELAGEGYAPPVRVLALRQLSLIAGEETVAAIAKWLGAPELREEAVFCLERIPGTASAKALLAAYRGAKDDFKPRLLAAFGHRRIEDAVPLCVEAMQSPNRDLALAGTRAFGRIGKKMAAAPRFNEPAGLSAWQKVDHFDAQLRFADAQVQQGNHAVAMKIYKAALERPEEHWQCAGITGIARMNTPEAAATIFPKLKSSNRVVRLTAENVWRAMAVEKAG